MTSSEHHNCAHFVLNSNSLQPAQAYSSKGLAVLQLLVLIGSSEFQ